MKTVLLCNFLLLSLIASAQDNLKTISPALLYGVATYDFPGSYGFKIGTSVPFHSIIKEKANKNSTNQNSKKDEFISAELGTYHRPFAYSALIADAGIGIRYIKSTKHFTELSINQGIVRTVYDGKVYELDQDGNIKERKLFGRTYLATGFSYALNWSLNNGHSNLWFIQLKPAIWIQYPYNSFLKLHLLLQAGISYRLKNIVLFTRTKYRHSK